MKKNKSKAKGFISLHNSQNSAKPVQLQFETPLDFSSPQVSFLRDTHTETTADHFDLRTACTPPAVRDDENFFFKVIESAPEPFCSAHPDGRLKAYNQAFLNLTGYSKEELKAIKLSDIVPSDCRDRYAALLAQAAQRDHPLLSEMEYIRKDGSRVPVEASVHRIADENRNVAFYCWFFRNSTMRSQAEKEVQQVNERLSNYVSELEQRNRETELFSEMVSLLQACVTIEEVQSIIGRLVRELFSSDSGAMYLLNSMRTQFEPVALWGQNKPGEQGISGRECWSMRLGKMYVVDAGMAGVLCSHVKAPVETASLCIPLAAQGETLGLLHIVFSPGWLSLSPDARERQKRHKQQLAIAVAENIALSLANFKLRDSLYIQSIHDYLTGLYNRRYMAELLEKELHRMARKKLPAGIIIIDIDLFKGINDRFGHEAGDLVLREFSLFLRKNIREEDFACRYGGDEFVIILPETSLENARQRAEQLRAGVKHVAVQFREHRLDMVTLSLGVAVYPNHGLTAETLLRTADAALYRAKAEGRDRVVSL
jgi:diguanylate cyclase (GGDEF)-like protein/PAS domain S-box-containing protein